MINSYLKGMLAILIGISCCITEAVDSDHLAIVPVSIRNLNISGVTTNKENLKRVVYFPEYKGLLMIGFMHYMYNLNHQNKQAFTTVLFYTLLKDPKQVSPLEYKKIYSILSDEEINIDQMISQLNQFLKHKSLKTNISGLSINLRSAILQISEIAKGNFDAVSPFIINNMIQDVDWSDFENILTDPTVSYYQKSLQAINHGHNIFLNCAKDKNRRRHRNDFSLYNGNVRWLPSTKFVNGKKIASAIELSGLNHSAEEGNLGSLWDKVCNAPITQDFLR